MINETMAKRLSKVTVGEVQKVNATIELVDYDPGWPEQFHVHRRRIADALDDRAEMIEHVGSTAVPGLAAKPRVDILLVVSESGDEVSYVPALERAGYHLRIREPEWHEHRMMNHVHSEVNLHIFSTGCGEIERMLGFRDWLRAHPDDRALYEQTKRELAAITWQFVQEYADAKSQVVEEILSRALTAADQ